MSCSVRSHRAGRERTARRGSLRAHLDSPEALLTIDEAIRDLLELSTDITAVVVVDGAGDLVASGPGRVSATAVEAATTLWEAAARRAAPEDLEHVVVPVPGGTVAIVQAHDHRAAAVSGPRPPVALLLFDLRTCLADAYGVLGKAS